MLKPTLRQTRLALVGPVLIAAAGIGFTNPAEAQCNRGPVSCTEIANTIACSATLMCSNAPSNDSWTLLTTSQFNVLDCSPGSSMVVGATVTFNLMASAATNAPTTRYCSWSWYTPSSGPGGIGNVFIDDTDGLPVELMELEVYEE